MMMQRLDGERIMVIHDFLSAAECASLIEMSERAGYEEATISTLDGPVLDKDLRNNARLVRDDPAMAADWWQRAASFVPARIKSWHAVGLGERFRFYRYEPGQKFEIHLDGYVERVNGEQSHYTFLVYLNDNFTGGSTNFYDFTLTPSVTVQPRSGMALIFAHRQFHEGAPVLAGSKYVLRTDVFYANHDGDHGAN